MISRSCVGVIDWEDLIVEWLCKGWNGWIMVVGEWEESRNLGRWGGGSMWYCRKM